MGRASLGVCGGSGLCCPPGPVSPRSVQHPHRPPPESIAGQGGDGGGQNRAVVLPCWGGLGPPEPVSCVSPGCPVAGQCFSSS